MAIEGNPPIPASKPKIAALDMLGSSFLSGGMPSFQGGDAGPAISSANSGVGSLSFGNSFTVAGSGGRASASETQSETPSTNFLLIALAGLAVLVVGKKL